jgi:hypothetical protein
MTQNSDSGDAVGDAGLNKPTARTLTSQSKNRLNRENFSQRCLDFESRILTLPGEANSQMRCDVSPFVRFDAVNVNSLQAMAARRRRH